MTESEGGGFNHSILLPLKLEHSTHPQHTPAAHTRNPVQVFLL